MTRVLAQWVCAGLLLAQRPPVEEAWDLVAKGARAEAVAVLDRIIRANPRDADARLLLGSILAEEGKHPEAIAQLSEAARLRPGSVEAHNALGEAFSASGDAQAARAEFEKAAELDPKFAPARVSLGLILVQAGDFAGAAEHLDRGLEILGRSEDAAFPHYLRAKVYMEENQAQKAAAELAEAVALRPDFAEAWSDLGLARKGLLDDEGAFAAYQRAVKEDPDSAVSQYRLGSEYLRRGSAREAVMHLEIALRLNPRDQSTLNSLQLALRQDGQVERANQVRKMLAELIRERDRASQKAMAALRLNNEGAALEKAGALAAALEKYRAAVELDPEHTGIRINFGVALLRLGRWREGVAELRSALRRDPGNELLKKALDDALSKAPTGALENPG